MKAICLLIGVGAIVLAVRPELLDRLRPAQAVERPVVYERDEPDWVRDGASAWIPNPNGAYWRRTEENRRDREDTGRAHAQDDYLFWRRQGEVPSGMADVDEAQRVAARVNGGNLNATMPPRWRDRIDAARKWNDARTDRSGPPEERLGASHAKTPGWVGTPLGVREDEREERPMTMGRAAKRFVTGDTSL